MSKQVRFVVRPDTSSRYRLPLVHRLQFSRCARFGDWIADTGECASEIDPPYYHLTKEAALAERLEILREAMAAHGEAI